MDATFTDKATPHEAAELQHTLERGYKRAYQAARETFAASPWGPEYESRFQTAAECNAVAADVVHETLESGMRRPCEATAEFLSRTKAEAQTAEANRAGVQTAGQPLRAQADADTNPAQARTPASHAYTPAERESADRMNDAEIEQQIADELMDRELARRDIADRSLMDAAAAMRYSRPKLGLYELRSCLDDGHLDAARQLIAEADADTQYEAEAG